MNGYSVEKQNQAAESLSMRYPARTWKEGFPCGNGSIGAMVYGRVHLEKILFNHESYYYRSRNAELPDISSWLPVLRDRLLSGDLEEANGLYEKVLREKGYDPSIAIYQPGFDLNLTTPVTRPFQRYQRRLDMSKGEAITSWVDGETAFERHLFVSRAGPFALLKLSASKEHSIEIDIGLSLHDTRDAIAQDGNRMSIPLEFRMETSANHILARGHETGNTAFFGGVLRVHAEGGTLKTLPEGIRVEAADEVLVFVRPMSATSTEKDLLEAKEKLQSMEPDYAVHLNRHLEIHRTYFGAMRFQLKDRAQKGEDECNEDLLAQAYEGQMKPLLVEKLFNYGRYLLLSSSAPGGLPSHLQGLWNGDYDPPWQCFYMANENIQMNYWQALPVNLPECVLPLFDYYESLIDDFRKCARHLYGCRGIYVPAATAPDSGLCKILQSHLLYWTGAAGWLARHFYDYYLYTLDESFLRKRALPFMVEAALFYEDFLFPDKEGKLMFAPGISPENHSETRYRSWAEGGPLFVSINPTMEVAICRELFTHLLEASAFTGLYEERREQWTHLLDRLPEYTPNEDGAIREWLHPNFTDHYNHRHLSHLYPLFPGNSVDPNLPSAELDAFKTAVEKRLVVGLHEQTGWSLMHMANIYARLGQAERAYECLQLLTRSCLGQNFFTYHNDDRGSGITMDDAWGRGPAFQLDANMGWTAAICEMLVYARPFDLVLLPSLPEAWSAGKVEGMLCRGGLQLSMEWDLNAGYLGLDLYTSRHQTWHIQVPGNIQRVYGPHSECIHLIAPEKGRFNLSLEAQNRSFVEVELGSVRAAELQTI